MTIKLIYDSQPDIKTELTLGPRVSADIQRRIRELEARWPHAITPADRRELHKLKVFLALLRTGEHCDD